jgi:hypothetical protein
MSKLYESHITVCPLFDSDLDKFKEICADAAVPFKVANLLMQKRSADTPERSKNDTFCTGHHSQRYVLQNAMVGLIEKLQMADIKVWRYKIEEIVIVSMVEIV